ncbi:MAG: NAD-dependent deacylase [Thermoplasmata archaeon]|nr:NAD-dependent deacylase [Thermoplasmata archaeon]
MLGDVAEKLQNAKRVAVLTGAGISAESGIATFRGKGGLWERYDVEKLATPRGLKSDPAYFWEWFEGRRREMLGAEPNPGHRALAELEKLVESFTLITQNIDRLHQRAGSKNVLELHGNAFTIYCPRDGWRMETYEPLPSIPPFCQCGAVMRPDVVLFEEPLDEGTLRSAFLAAENAEVFMSIGTSAVVYPAAYLPVEAQRNGAFLIEINPEETPLTAIADAVFQQKAGEILPKIVEKLRG